MNSFEKLMSSSGKAKESCSTDQSKFGGNNSTDGKINDVVDEKVDYTTAGKAITPVTEGAEMKKPWCRLILEVSQANDNNVNSSEKLMSSSEKEKESCSTDQSKLNSNSLADEKVDDVVDGKVDGATAKKAVKIVTEGAETKKPWCRLISEFSQVFY